ncbi:rifin, partial [Plasmodium reichenowi]
MKEVMENFNKQTQQRFHEYDDRMKTTRQKCKDKCDKEIQKIILKDKLEKHMAEQLTTLETKINTDDIPTCICEKSLADKTEKFCLNCGKNMGAIAPWWGLVCGAGYGGWSHYA